MSNLGDGGLAGVDLKPLRGRVSDCQRVEEQAKQAGDDRTRAHQRAARREALSLLLACMLLLSVGGNIVLGMIGIREKVVPVLVDHLGREQVLPREEDMTIPPEKSMILGVLQDWIEHVRWVSNDPAIFARGWKWVHAYMTPAGLRQLADFEREQMGRQHQGRRVKIEVLAVLPIADAPQSYTIDWIERAYGVNGELLESESLLGEATVVIADFQGPAARQARSLLRKHKIFRNTRGIFIDEINWRFRPLPRESASTKEPMR